MAGVVVKHVLLLCSLVRKHVKTNREEIRQTYSVGRKRGPAQLCLSFFRIQQHHCRK